MNDRSRRYVECGQRCRQWKIDHPTLIPVGSIFETKLTALTDVVGELEDLFGEAESFTGEGLSATDVKGSERIDLIDIMKIIRDAARAAESDNPGTRDRYRYTTNLSDQALLAAGRSFVVGGVDDMALLVGYGAPAGWPTAVEQACNAFEASFGPQDSAVGSRVGANAVINEKLTVFTALKSTISHMVPNFCSSDKSAIAAWNSAAHIEAPPKKKVPPPTPPTP